MTALAQLLFFLAHVPMSHKEFTPVVTLLHFYVGLKELKLDIGYRDSLKLHYIESRGAFSKVKSP